MKKFIYFTAVASINIFLAGALMKMLHYPGAGILLTAGLGTIALVVLPLATYTAYQDSMDHSQFWVYITGFLCAVIDILGALFKVQHYPGGNMLLLVGIPLPFVVFLPVYIYNNIRHKDQPIKGLLGVMFLMTYIAVFSVLLAVKHG